MSVPDRVNHIARINTDFARVRLARAYGIHQGVGGLCVPRLIRRASKNFECGYRSRVIVSAATLPREPGHHEQLERLSSGDTPPRVAIQLRENEIPHIVDRQIAACENRGRLVGCDRSVQRLQLADDRL
jgi:hypothetical protein